MKLYLIGYRGAGKSTVSELLSEHLSLKKISMDDLLVERFEKSINDVVSEKGWDYFRIKECELLKELSKETGSLIVDCGGGIIERAENRQLLKQEQYVFFLKTSIEQIKIRLQNATDRPALSKDKNFLDEIEEIYKRRLPLYEEAATYVIDADKAPLQIFENILQFLNKK